jgi:3-methyladenine DNA glycosylase AlkD
MDVPEILAELRKRESPKDREGMARFGIKVGKAFGISVYVLRDYAKKIGKDQALSLELWKTGFHEARLLAVFIGEPSRVTEKQMNSWAGDFDSWDVCDQACTDLFDQTPFAYRKAAQWSSDKREFVKRAAFALMAGLAVHDKKSGDEVFEKLLPIIERESWDERNFVRKAVNWALRNIGKRNLVLNRKAIEAAKRIRKTDSKAARWIADDAIRELESEKVKKRIK